MISVIVLIALIVIAIICAALLKVSVARRSNIKAEERRVQAALLAESGIDRAVSRLSASRDYTGETWEISSEDLGGRGPAVVLIAVVPGPDPLEDRKVRVTADFPARSEYRTRESRELSITIPPPQR
jgi:Tfp pilus assembly protein PilV